jgi:hypothetical protein
LVIRVKYDAPRPFVRLRYFGGLIARRQTPWFPAKDVGVRLKVGRKPTRRRP